MSKPAESKKVKLILSAIYSDRPAWLSLLEGLEEKYGGIDYSSKEMDFHYTGYYEEEMGATLARELVSFARLIRPEDLSGIKLFTNQRELSQSRSGKRKVNLDPGFLSLDQMTLATGKPAPHRVYLRDGIWADLHLIYESGGFQPMNWTYPDYRSESIIGVFNRLREVLKLTLKTGGERDAV